MRRREFMRVVGCEAATWPITPHAQQRTMQVLGYLGAERPNARTLRKPTGTAWERP
jgi:hypothetical protein